MDTLLLIAILFGLAAVAVLIIYLIDRVRRIELLAGTVAGAAAPSAPHQAAPLFGDLSGKRLWDAITGKPVKGWDKQAIDLIRNRYQAVLKRHVEELFHEGLSDAREGAAQPEPRNTRVITTMRGAVESWLPQQHATTIYRAGAERAGASADALAALRRSLDDAAETLFTRAGLKLARPISADLLGEPPAPEATAAAPAASGASAEAATPAAAVSPVGGPTAGAGTPASASAGGAGGAGGAARPSGTAPRIT